MGKTAFDGANRKDTFLLPPESFTIITDPSHPAFDERALEPLHEELVDDILMRGQITPVLVERNGYREDGSQIIEVINGRQRIRAIIEINKRLEKAGKPPMKVHFQHMVFADNKARMGAMIAENEIRFADNPMTKAVKLARYMRDAGATEREAAVTFGISPAECSKLIKMLNLCDKAKAAVDEGVLSFSAATKLIGMNRKEQESVLGKIISEGGKITADRIERQKHGDGGIPSPKKQRCKSRKEIEEMLANPPDQRNPEFYDGWDEALKLVLCIQKEGVSNG